MSKDVWQVYAVRYAHHERMARENFMAQATRFDKYTVSMTHPDGVVALLGGSGAISAHFTSPPFHQRERKDPHVHTIMQAGDVNSGAAMRQADSFRDGPPRLPSARNRSGYPARDEFLRGGTPQCRV